MGIKGVISECSGEEKGKERKGIKVTLSKTYR